MPASALAPDLACGAMLPVGPQNGSMTDNAVVSGWVWESQVVRLLRWLSTYTGYDYDWWDEQALSGALKTTDEESGVWFDLPLAGEPSLLVQVAVNAGSNVVSIRVAGPMPDVLVARVDTLIAVCSESGQ